MSRGIPIKDRRILVLCPDWPQPSGGVRKIYRHVEILNSLGYRAFIRHQQKDFRCTWFESGAPVIEPEKSWPPDPASDVLVCPEIVAWQMVSITASVPKVIFNQNAYQTFKGMDEKNSAAPYLNEDFLGTIVVSDDSRLYLNQVFPKHPAFRIHNAIDPSLFYIPDSKKRHIAYMPRKMAAHVVQVISILLQRSRMDGFELHPIQNLSESQTANVMRDAMIFLSFSTQEGSPMPPLEAMASGTLVIGYDGQGGREYVNYANAIPIAEEDVLGFAKAVEQAIADFRESPQRLSEKTTSAAVYVAANHSPQRERDDIAQAWDQLSRLL